jgi:hypothetical protein
VSKRLSVALTCWLMLWLTGCSDSSSSSADPPTPTPTSSSPAPSAEKPETPEEFVRRWVVLNTEMQNTGETEEFEATCPKSGSCQRLVRLVRSYYEAGGYLRTGAWKVVKVDEVGGERRIVQLNVDIKSAPTAYKKSADGPVARFAGGITHNQFFLRWTVSAWLIQEWTQSA